MFEVPMKTPLLLSLCSASTLAYLGCKEPDGDLFTVNGVVTGDVRDETGAPVDQATVHATLAGREPSPESSFTGSDGVYSIRFRALNEPEARVPLTLQVDPPAGSSLLGRDTTGLTILIARGWPPRETTRVDIVLHAP